MLTRDQINAVPQLPLEVVTFSPATGKWTKHANKETIPTDAAYFFTEAGDLFNLSVASVEESYKQVTGSFLTKAQRRTGLHAALWRALRGMQACDSTLPSAMLPANYLGVWEKRLAAMTPRKTKLRRPAAKVASRTGSPGFVRTFKPGDIESMDRKFFALTRSLRAIVEAILDLPQESFSREELAEALRTSSVVAAATAQDPWDVFCKHRASLVRQGFIAAMTPLQHAAKVGVVLPPPPVVKRKREPADG